MKVTALVLDYPPHRFIGAELALHALLKELQPGNTITVRSLTALRHNYDGIRVVPEHATVRDEPDVVIVNAALGSRARRHYPKTPLVVWGHNNQVHTLLDFVAASPDLLIANSQHMADVLVSTIRLSSIVLHPPVKPAERIDPPGMKLGLVNLTEDKGSRLAWSIAEAHPEWEFVGIKGGYGTQITSKLPNVTTLEHGASLDEFWAQTSILLIPSYAESYSMVGIEAATRGIPSVAISLPGVREALAPAGALFVPTHDVEDWGRAIAQAIDERDARSYDALEGARTTARQVADEMAVAVAAIKELVSSPTEE